MGSIFLKQIPSRHRIKKNSTTYGISFLLFLSKIDKKLKMRKEIIEDKTYKGENYTEKTLPIAEYENCIFSNCVFLNTDLSEIIFVECIFEDCDMSMAILKGTAFRDVAFKGCKLLGLHFDDCNPFLLSFNFDSCTLNFSSFFKLKLKNIQFKDCKLEEVDFVETDLSNAVFTNCDLNKAVFDNTKLEGADFRTAINFAIDPEINSVKKAKFSALNIAGLLIKYNITIT